jgi:hypothetical protein
LRWSRRLTSLLPFGAFLTILGLIIGASLAARYPFGGEMRQQSILFPFLILSFGGLAASVLSRLSRIPATVCGALLVLGLAVNAARQLPKWATYYPASFAEADRVLANSFPGTRVMYTDQFGVVAFFSRHFDWRWSYVKRVAGSPELLLYRLKRGNATLDVFYDRTRWVARFDRTPLFYRSLRSALEASSSACLVVYRLVPAEGAGLGIDEPEESIERAARAIGLRLGRDVRFGSNRLVEVCRGPRAPSASGHSLGARDGVVPGGGRAVRPERYPFFGLSASKAARKESRGTLR